MKGLAGKSVVVTGGETGIGRAIVLRCAAEGALVVAAGIQTDKLDEVVGLAEQAQSQGRVVAVPTDVRQRDQIDAMLQRAVGEFGRLDAAIANAATFNPATPLIDTDMKDWHRVIAVNLTGAFETLQAAARILIAQGEGGSLLATTSSTVGRPSVGVLPYIAAKGGLDLLMRALAVELAPYNIRCNTIMPGFARTAVLDIYSQDYIDKAIAAAPMKALVEPEELAGLVAFAISEEAPHMTGTVLKVDAGRTAG
jgi:NAD(P)-dependent dehydrogenase (short-subunit alcohol dehydrogenase family)